MSSPENDYMISNRKYDGKFLPEVSNNGTLTFFSTPVKSPNGAGFTMNALPD